MDPLERDAYDIAIVGGGNMGAALLAGMLASGAFDPVGLVVVEPLAARRDELADRFPGVAVTAEVPTATNAVIAVKPPDVAAVAVAAVRQGARRVLSIAAGITTAAIETAIEGSGAAAVDAAVDAAVAAAVDAAVDVVAVVRAMPNTPSLVGRGVAAICGGRDAGPDDLAWAESVLGAVGICVRLDESQFDAVTAVTGSGPAYVFFVAEALTDAGLAAGLPAEVLGPMITQLLVGSAELLARDGDPVALRAMVTSPGGTTAAGVEVLERRDVRGIVAEVVAAATARSRELGAG